MWAFGLCLFYLGFCYTEVCYIPGFWVIYFTLTFARWKNIICYAGDFVKSGFIKSGSLQHPWYLE